MALSLQIVASSLFVLLPQAAGVSIVSIKCSGCSVGPCNLPDPKRDDVALQLQVGGFAGTIPRCPAIFSPTYEHNLSASFADTHFTADGG